MCSNLHVADIIQQTVMNGPPPTRANVFIATTNGIENNCFNSALTVLGFDRGRIKAETHRRMGRCASAHNEVNRAFLIRSCLTTILNR